MGGGGVGSGAVACIDVASGICSGVPLAGLLPHNNNKSK